MFELTECEAASVMRSLDDALENIDHTTADPGCLEHVRRHVIRARSMLSSVRHPERGLTPILDIIAPIVRRERETRVRQAVPR